MSFINDYIKPTDFGAVRKDINRILELIHDIVAQEPEDAGLEQRIAITPHLKRRTQSVNWDLVTKFSESRSKVVGIFRRLIGSTSTSADGLTESEVGSGLTFPANNTKFGGRCDFDGSSYVKINNHSSLKPSTFSFGGYFYIPATDSGDTLPQNLLENGSRYSLVVDPHVIASNQIRAHVAISGGTGTIDDELSVSLDTETGIDLELDNKITPYYVTGTITADSWNHIWVTYSDPNLKLYINKTLVDTNSSATGTLAYDDFTDDIDTETGVTLETEALVILELEQTSSATATDVIIG